MIRDRFGTSLKCLSNCTPEFFLARVQLVLSGVVLDRLEAREGADKVGEVDHLVAAGGRQLPVLRRVIRRVDQAGDGPEGGGGAVAEEGVDYPVAEGVDGQIWGAIQYRPWH